MKLQNYGFIRCGECTLDKKLKQGVRFKIWKLKNRRVIYAFVVDGKPKYIGACEAINTTLANRMGNYRSNPERTNKKVRSRVKECLKNGQAVEIFAWQCDCQFKYRGLSCDDVMGFEGPFIRKLNPEWNDR